MKTNIAAMALVSSALLSTPAHAWNTPNAAIEEFMRFELSGGRLSAWDYGKYLAAKPGYEEPGWDQVELIRKAKIQSIDCSDSWCITRVLFVYEATDGIKSDQVVPHPYGGHRVEQYKILNVRGKWLMESTNGLPKVSFPTFQKLMLR